MKIIKTMAVLGGVLLMGACSSIVEGTTQNVTVMTDPSGASCNLTRDGAVIGVVNPTPGSITIDKSKDDVSIICKKDGFQTTGGNLASSFQGMTFGNILFGGIIGVAVDASSGAMNKYPGSLQVTMLPDKFPNANARDVYFDQLVASKHREAAAAIEKASTECSAATPEMCQARIQAIQVRLNADVAELESKRQMMNATY